MILKIKREKYSGTEEIYKLYNKNNNEIYSYESITNNNGIESNIQYNNDIVNIFIPKSYKEKSIIYSNNQDVGFIECVPTEKAISTSYYWNMSFKGRNLKLYEIGFGNKGIYFVIKENDKTIAIISSVMIANDFKDSNDLFVDNDKDSIIAIICAIYWNLYRGASFIKDGSSGLNTINKTLTTLSREIKEKMDFEFMNNIAKQENYVIDNKSKKSSINTIIGVTLLAIFIIFLIIVLILG